MYVIHTCLNSLLKISQMVAYCDILHLDFLNLLWMSFHINRTGLLFKGNHTIVSYRNCAVFSSADPYKWAFHLFLAFCLLSFTITTFATVNILVCSILLSYLNLLCGPNRKRNGIKKKKKTNSNTNVVEKRAKKKLHRGPVLNSMPEVHLCREYVAFHLPVFEPLPNFELWVLGGIKALQQKIMGLRLPPCL